MVRRERVIRLDTYSNQPLYDYSSVRNHIVRSDTTEVRWMTYVQLYKFHVLVVIASSIVMTVVRSPRALQRRPLPSSLYQARLQLIPATIVFNRINGQSRNLGRALETRNFKVWKGRESEPRGSGCDDDW